MYIPLAKIQVGGGQLFPLGPHWVKIEISYLSYGGWDESSGNFALSHGCFNVLRLGQNATSQGNYQLRARIATAR